MIDYTTILRINYAGKKWLLHGDEYEGLEWLDDSPKPTKEELDSLWEETLTQLAAEKQAKIDAKQSALNKLMALGLTEEEALALGVK
jgi:hypothetical protein